MDKIVKIKDSTFLPYSNSASLREENAHVHPTHFRWEYSDDDYVIATDGNIRGMREDAIAWLIEPRCLRPENYELPELKSCRAVFTYDHKLTWELNKGYFEARALYYSLGGSSIAFNKWGMTDKTEKVCMFWSKKDTTEGHKLRSQIANKFGDRVDVFHGIASKYDVLSKYQYCIVVESGKIDRYMTEKLIDPISTGTIPIYWGYSSIPFLISWGVHLFEDIDELEDLLDWIYQADYYGHHYQRIRNIRIAQQYRICEDSMFHRAPSLFGVNQ